MTDTKESLEENVTRLQGMEVKQNVLLTEGDAALVLKPTGEIQMLAAPKPQLIVTKSNPPVVEPNNQTHMISAIAVGIMSPLIQQMIRFNYDNLMQEQMAQVAMEQELAEKEKEGEEANTDSGEGKSAAGSESAEGTL